MANRYYTYALSLLLLLAPAAKGQDVQALLAKVRAKIEQVNDYTADARLQIDVSFMQVPESPVTVYFRKPDDFRIRKAGGISILPKGGLTVSLNSLLSGSNFAAIDAGIAEGLRVVKLVPLQETGDIALTTLYIEEKTLLVRRAITTTRNNGTYQLDLEYGAYAAYALPGRAVFTFNTSGYKLPKGLALDYDPGTPAPKTSASDGKGRFVLIYSKYVINKGVPEDMFK
jgi:hypothetical protein